jgi:hypothetical protein
MIPAHVGLEKNLSSVVVRFRAIKEGVLNGYW